MPEDEPTGIKCPGPSAAPKLTVPLAIRFLLELVLLAALGVWGWRLGNGGVAGGALALVVPTTAAVLWGLFSVPGDPSRNPRALVAVPGVVRLALEWALFGLAAYGLWSTGSRAAAETLLTVTGLHYALSWERIVWLVRH